MVYLSYLLTEYLLCMLLMWNQLCIIFLLCHIIEEPLGMALYEALYLNESINLIIKIMCPHQVWHCNFLLLMWRLFNSCITKQGVSSASNRIVLTFNNITKNTSQIQLECSSPCLVWRISGLMVYFQVLFNWGKAVCWVWKSVDWVSRFPEFLWHAISPFMTAITQSV